MQDVLIKMDENGLYDLQISGADFESAEGFESAVPTSFFSDSRASSVQVQEAQSRRGWVGNILTVDIDRELGGLLWILDQARINDDTINFARNYARDSLQWMIDDGIARNIQVIVEKEGTSKIEIYTNIINIDNTVTKFVTLWRSTDFKRILQ